MQLCQCCMIDKAMTRYCWFLPTETYTLNYISIDMCNSSSITEIRILYLQFPVFVSISSTVLLAPWALPRGYYDVSRPYYEFIMSLHLLSSPVFRQLNEPFPSVHHTMIWPTSYHYVAIARHSQCSDHSNVLEVAVSFKNESYRAHIKQLVLRRSKRLRL